MQGPQGPQYGTYGANPYPMQPHHAAPMAPFVCRACGHAGHPMLIDKVTTAGWVVLGLLLVFCITAPFFFIPLVWMKERRMQCPRCHVTA